MIKVLIFVGMIMVIVECQRPPYAGSSNHHHHTLPQYLENKENNTDNSIGNRIDGSSTNMSSTNRPYRDPDFLPPQAAGDWNIIDTISTWPKERQPFWYINWKQIQEQIGGKQPPSTLFPIRRIKN